MVALDYPVVVAAVACVADGVHATLLLQHVGVPLGVVLVSAEIAQFVHVAAIHCAGKAKAAGLVHEVEQPQLAIVVFFIHELGSTTYAIHIGVGKVAAFIVDDVYGCGRLHGSRFGCSSTHGDDLEDKVLVAHIALSSGGDALLVGTPHTSTSIACCLDGVLAVQAVDIERVPCGVVRIVVLVAPEITHLVDVAAILALVIL